MMFKSGLQISPVNPKQEESYFKNIFHPKTKFCGFGNLYVWGNLFFSKLPEKYFHIDTQNYQLFYPEHTEDSGM